MIRFCLAAIALCILTGCVSIREITSSNAYWGDYKKGAVYRLKKDASIVNLKSNELPFISTYYFNRNIPGYSLTKPNSYDRKGPSDEPDKWPAIVAIAPKGTRLRFDRVIFHDYFESSTTYPFAVILDGSLAGADVSIRDLSIKKPRSRYLCDTNWLEEISQSGPGE
jgi:hypothetical protein